jgi:retron-type reverse transcriptase
VRKALARIQPPDFLFCPVKRRSYVSNAAQHVGAKEIRTLDVQSYFATTPRHRVYWFFHTIMRCSADVASIFAQLLTVDGHLATGSTVSPFLAFFAFYDMWLEIAKIAMQAGCTLTVYMDDITISGDYVPDRVIWEIKKEIHKRGLRYHKEHRYAGGIGEVTGTVVRNGRLQVPNRQRKKAYETRVALDAATDSAEVEKLTNSLRGLNLQRQQIENHRPALTAM